MGNIDKNYTAIVITTLTFSFLALAAIIYQHSSAEVSGLETPVVEAVFENAQETDQGVSISVNETGVELESDIESLGTTEIVISFKSAFSAARKQYGPGKTFVYKSKEYSTSYAKELNNNSVNFSQDQKGNFTAEENLAETSSTIITGVFSHSDKTND